MGRLSTLITGVALSLAMSFIGCNSAEEPALPGRDRVVSVAAKAPLKTAEQWCDVYFSTEQAKKLVLPQATPVSLSSGIVKPPLDHWIWLNFWATWCGPCLREIPLIEQWKGSLARDGIPLALWFVSLDESPEDLGQFLGTHPEMVKTNSVRLSETSAFGPWIEKYGLPSNTTIPVNILADPSLNVRCIRIGSINDGDFPIVRRFLASMHPH